MLLHIRILWGLLDSTSIPFDPHPEVLASFSKRFSTETQLQALIVNQARPLINTNHILLPGAAILKKGSRIITNYGKIDENVLEYIKGCIARFGLSSWCPDLRQNPKSLYNSACRIIAIDTFQQALVAGAYSRAFTINTRYATNTEILIKTYDHCVFYFFAGRYRRDVRNPGSVVRADEKGTIYKNRQRVCAYI